MDLDAAIQLSRQAVEKDLVDSDAGLLWNDLGRRLWDRWAKRGLPVDLDEAIHAARQAAETTTLGPQKIEYMNSLGNRLFARYKFAWTTTDLQESIEVAREVAKLASGERDPAKYFVTLGNRLHDRYMELSEFSDLEGSIQAAEDAVNAAPDGEDHIKYLDTLVNRLSDRYSELGVRADLDEIIERTRAILKESKQLQDINMDPLDQARLFYSLADYLHTRYSLDGSILDLEEAILEARKAVDISGGGFIPVQYLELLGMLHRLRYFKTERQADLEEAVRVGMEAVERAERFPGRPLASGAWRSLKATLEVANIAIRKADNGDEPAKEKIRDAHPDARDSAEHGNLDIATHLTDKHLEGIEKDIKVFERTIRALQINDPGCYPNRFSEELGKSLMGLGALLYERYNETGSAADLDTSIYCTRQSICLMSETHRYQAATRRKLQSQLVERYERSGDQSDLEEAIERARAAIQATPGGELNKTTDGLFSISTKLLDRYLSTGEIVELDESLKVMQQVVELIPDGHIDRGNYINSLAMRFMERYEGTGVKVDLEEALRLFREAISLTPEAHPRQAMLLGNLGSALFDSYNRTKAVNDLRASIQTTRKATHLTSDGHPHRASWLNNLGASLACLYLETRDIAALEDAIQAARGAVSLSSSRVLDNAMYLNNLGNQLSYKYSETRAMSDLDDSIRTTGQAVDLLQETHPLKAKFLNNLGDRLSSKYLESRAATDLDQAVVCYQRALQSTSAATIDRVKAGIEVLRICPDWEQAYNAAVLAVSLVPKLMTRSLENMDRQTILSQVAGLACNAAAAALRVERAPLTALELLEQGRGVLWSSLDELRPDIQDLNQQSPELAKRFISLSAELEKPVTGASLVAEETRTPTAQPTRPDRRYDTGKEFDKLIKEIRETPGFARFLLPSNAAEIQGAASSGPIVVINVSGFRCDALLVEKHQIRSLPLPDLSESAITELEKSDSLGSFRVLKWLWDTVTGPVLDALGFTATPPGDGTWPHIWWIPTGPLSKFPLHASGYYGGDSTRTVLDRAVSSYSSSIKAIVNGRQRLRSSDSKQALLVPMTQTAKHAPLPFVAEEVEVIGRICESASLHIHQPRQRKQEVMSQLSQCSIFHFAGHGYSDIKDPAQSRLLLEDWKEDPLTVGDLLGLNLRERSPFLAYLSACDTGSITDERFFDEGIHLISACQIAGFRHVIGTLWEVSDRFCVAMARIIYAELTKGGMTDKSVSLGLHKASRMLRDNQRDVSLEAKYGRHSTAAVGLPSRQDVTSLGSIHPDGQESDGARNAALFNWDQEADEPDGSMLWVPYVHFGI